MSVHVCYLQRSDRGGMLRSLRLVGLTSDESWPPSPGPAAAQNPSDYDHAAAWIREQLAGTRSTSSLSMLCLDIEGSVCSWLTSLSVEPSVIATLARQGPASQTDAPGAAEFSRQGATPVQFYADTPMDSSVQTLAPVVDPEPLSKRNGTPPATVGQRMAVVATNDVPARLLVDALDRAAVPVETVASLWQVMSQAWDPGAARRGPSDERDVAASDAISAAVIVDPSGRLIWSWSRAGRLLVAGSMRLPVLAAQPAGPAEDSTPVEAGVRFGPSEVSRLTAEWLSWAAQVGRAPSRIICILPETGDALDEAAADFGRGLGEAWVGATVDLVTHADPIGATLHRHAERLENTPRTETEGTDPGVALLDLSRRPGRLLRRMYLWASLAIVMLATLVGAMGWRLKESAAGSRSAAAEWQKRWRAVLEDVYPDALRPVPGTSAYTLLKEEVDRREKAIQPIAKSELVMPVLEELETISMVIGNADYALELIELDTAGRPRLIALAPSTKDAEELLLALRRIGGSQVSDWAATYSDRREGEAVKVRGIYAGRWAPHPEGSGAGN